MAKGPDVTPTGVLKGTIFPNRADALKVADRIGRDLTTNPTLRKAFWQDPRGVLGAYGLNADLQRELLQDADITVISPLCIFTDCYHTCWFTKCYVTRIVVVKD
jgi:hypothetical protein